MPAVSPSQNLFGVDRGEGDVAPDRARVGVARPQPLVPGAESERDERRGLDPENRLAGLEEPAAGGQGAEKWRSAGGNTPTSPAVQARAGSGQRRTPRMRRRVGVRTARRGPRPGTRASARSMHPTARSRAVTSRARLPPGAATKRANEPAGATRRARE